MGESEGVQNRKEHQMKTLSTAAFIALAGLVAVPSIALADTNTNVVHGRDDFALKAALRDHGTPVQEVEEWGSYIRAWVADADGGSTMQFFDPDTLERVVR
jgi:hypothetical protein